MTDEFREDFLKTYKNHKQEKDLKRKRLNAQIRVEKVARVESEIGNGVPANKLIHSKSFRRRTITTYLFFNCKGVRQALEKGLVKNVEE